MKLKYSIYILGIILTLNAFGETPSALNLDIFDAVDTPDGALPVGPKGTFRYKHREKDGTYSSVGSIFMASPGRWGTVEVDPTHTKVTLVFDRIWDKNSYKERKGNSPLFTIQFKDPKMAEAFQKWLKSQLQSDLQKTKAIQLISHLPHGQYLENNSTTSDKINIQIMKDQFIENGEVEKESSLDDFVKTLLPAEPKMIPESQHSGKH